MSPTAINRRRTRTVSRSSNTRAALGSLRLNIQIIGVGSMAGLPFVGLQVGKGLYGVTKLRWRTWPERNWLSWLIAALFISGACVLIVVTTHTAEHEPQGHVAVRWGFTIGLAVLVVLRLIMEGTVSKAPSGQPPKWDRQLVDPWWTTIHTLTGVVLGLWLTPFIITVMLTTFWELLEISVPGFGDEEINGNRLTDNLVAWIGWLTAAGISALISGVALPII
jgi:hypothetical protein